MNNQSESKSKDMDFWKNFTTQHRKMLEKAIEVAETHTSGEIRVYIENSCNGDMMDRAASIFQKLDMHKTAARNGVLFYVAVKDHKFAILGDAGINTTVPENFWDNVRDSVLSHFSEDKIVDGLIEGIGKAGEELKAHFPYQSGDVNELPDDIIFGEDVEQ
ncbi:MAG: TPM domain-containing protein [Prolixibacteraceae bacterium]|nr:TPM domain-containing protein [Prolixibacteraceae bacterium]